MLKAANNFCFCKTGYAEGNAMNATGHIISHLIFIQFTLQSNLILTTTKNISFKSRERQAFRGIQLLTCLDNFNSKIRYLKKIANLLPWSQNCHTNKHTKTHHK